jgi:transmembrane sensor
MNPEHNQSQLDLLAKYLAGESTAEEAMQVDEWLANHENKKEFDRLVKLWNHTPQAAMIEIPEAEEVWRKIQETKPQARVKRLHVFRYVAAASVIIVAGLLSFLWITNQDKKSSEPALITKTAQSEVNTESLPDGSTIIIRKGSSVAFTDAFNRSEREVILKGECYFDVMPNKQKPFIIHIDDLNIQVVGTSFNVRSIADSGFIEVQVQTGIVKMYTANTEMMVRKGETGRYDKNIGSLRVINHLDVNSLSYATKTFSFNDIQLTEACRYLEEAFNIKINVDANKFRECRLTAHFENQSLSNILDVINATLNTTSNREGNTITIDGDGCR